MYGSFCGALRLLTLLTGLQPAKILSSPVQDPRFNVTAPLRPTRKSQHLNSVDDLDQTVEIEHTLVPSLLTPRRATDDLRVRRIRVDRRLGIEEERTGILDRVDRMLFCSGEDKRAH